MIRTYAVTQQSELIKDVPVTELVNGNFKWYWIDFDQPTKKEVELLKTPLNFHPLAIEDCLHLLQRPKLDYYDGCTFFVLQAINSAKHRFAKEEIDVFLGENFIVTFHHEVSEEIDMVILRLTETLSVKKWNPTILLYEIMDKITDSFFPLVNSIEDNLILIDESMKKKSMETMLKDLFATRRNLLILSQVISPMETLVYRMLKSHRLTQIKSIKEYFSDIHDHLLKLNGMIEAGREFSTDIRDSYMTMNSHQTNRVMKTLTIITTIFMPLTFIAGIYGMNFENMPELTWKYGYFETLILMCIIAIAMVIGFAKKGWFK